MSNVAPGLYTRDSMDYASIDAVNYSTMKYMARSPLAYRHRLANPAESTNGQLRGTLAHTVILERERLAVEYAVFDGDRRGRAWTDFKTANANRKIVKRSELDQAMDILHAVRRSREATEYLDGGAFETVMVWVDEPTGLLCKGRIDCLADSGAIVDIKGTSDAGPASFARDCARMKHHVQAAYYLDGYRSLFPLESPESVLIAIEHSAPHDVAVYRLDADSLEAGRRFYRSCLDRIAECRASGTWPGVANGEVADLRLPPYELIGDDDIELVLGEETFRG